MHGTGEPPTVQSQLLTVTEQGVWVDGERQDVHASATLFFKPEGSGGGTVEAGWCKLPTFAPPGTKACDHELPQELPTGPSRSFAWPEASSPFGARVITGFREGVTLRLGGSTFSRVLALGGGPSREPGATFGAAFSSPTEGWLGEGELPVHLTTSPAPSRLSPWPVSFRHALVAIAPEPGTAVGALTSGAIAVGDRGEVARYVPGSGWLPEALRGPSGRVEIPRLRAVAWPTPSRAYAVGDRGAMWLWRSETGTWEPDPAAVEVTGNLMGIAFDPNEPARGYAVGTGGLLLGYGKSWTQQPLPAQVQGASFTSIAFAGSEAIVAWRKLLNPSTRSSYIGGLLINSGSGWQVDQEAETAMGSVSKVPAIVAGLPDGGAAFVAEAYGSGEGGAKLFVRQSAGQPWQPAATPLPHGSAPGALALFRENGALRVVAAGSAPDGFAAEGSEPTPPGTPAPIPGPYPLPTVSGLGVVRQTATGWNDEQHELNDVAEPPGGYSSFDTVYEPDPVRALLVGPSGEAGWAVGGAVEPESHGGLLDTADVERYPAEGMTPPGIGSSTIPTEAGRATFAIGGNAQCAAPCSDRANAKIGPDVWLSAALARAGTIPGVRAFMYTGPRVTSGETTGPPTLVVPYAREFARYGQLLADSPLPTYAALSPTDLDGSHGECTFQEQLAGFPAGYKPESSSSESCGGQAGYYQFDSTGSAGTVSVIVLDGTGDVGSPQLKWLVERLEAAKGARTPAIVVGNADLPAQIAAGDAAAAAVASALIAHGASAYFYDSPEENVKLQLRAGGGSIPAYGSGTLGYVNYQGELGGEFLGAGGFLLVQIDVAAREAATNRVPEADLGVRLIPNIGELALEAKSGTVLPRSKVAEFAGLARRPRAGNRSPGGAEVRPDTDPYIPIPSNCVGTRCSEGEFPEYTFTSSRPEIGNFVEPNLASGASNEPLLSNEKTIPDPQSGLFCAYNPGTTTVTISAGGLSSSLQVTVEGGSVRRPCGTVPDNEGPVTAQAPVTPPPAPAPAATPAGAAPVTPLPLPPPAPALTPTPAPHLARLLPSLIVPAPPQSLLAALFPPLPTPARPTPPSGTSAVTSPVEAPQKEEEQEEATESVSNQAVAYRASDDEPVPLYILGIVILAAFAGASAIPRRRRAARRPQYAHARAIDSVPTRSRDERRYRA